MAAQFLVAIVMMIAAVLIIVGMFLYSRDKSEARKHEKEMAREEKDYEALMEHIEEEEN